MKPKRMLHSTRRFATKLVVKGLDPVNGGWPLPLPPPRPPAKGSKGRGKHTLALGINVLVRAGSVVNDEYDYDTGNYNVELRPHVGPFLKEVSDLFDVVLWTSRIAAYGVTMARILQDAAELPPLPPSESQAHDVPPFLTHWSLLTRFQTLEANDNKRLKYIPLLGRQDGSVIMIDRYKSNFTLTPRAGVLIQRDDFDNEPRTLLNLLPMLRAVSAAPSAVGEMDFWRPDDYIECDNFAERNYYTIGRFLKKRRTSGPIPALVHAAGNHERVKVAEQLLHKLWNESKHRPRRQRNGKQSLCAAASCACAVVVRWW